MLFCSLPFYLPLSTEVPLQIAPLVSWKHTELVVWRELNRLCTKRGSNFTVFCKCLDSSLFYVRPTEDLRKCEECIGLWYFTMVQLSLECSTHLKYSFITARGRQMLCRWVNKQPGPTRVDCGWWSEQSDGTGVMLGCYLGIFLCGYISVFWVVTFSCFSDRQFLGRTYTLTDCNVLSVTLTRP